MCKRPRTMDHRPQTTDDRPQTTDHQSLQFTARNLRFWWSVVRGLWSEVCGPLSAVDCSGKFLYGQVCKLRDRIAGHRALLRVLRTPGFEFRRCGYPRLRHGRFATASQAAIVEEFGVAPSEFGGIPVRRRSVSARAADRGAISNHCSARQRWHG